MNDKGYTVVEYNGTGMLEIQKVNGGMYGNDAEAVLAAVRDGVKLIPVSDLPDAFPLRRLGWLDTPANRKRIGEYAREHGCGQTGRKLLRGLYIDDELVMTEGTDMESIGEWMEENAESVLGIKGLSVDSAIDVRYAGISVSIDGVLKQVPLTDMDEVIDTVIAPYCRPSVRWRIGVVPEITEQLVPFSAVTLGTCNLSPATRFLLEKLTDGDTDMGPLEGLPVCDLPVYEKAGYGWFLYVCDVEESRLTEANGYPADLAGCIRIAKHLGCDLLVLDCDGPAI